MVVVGIGAGAENEGAAIVGTGRQQRYGPTEGCATVLLRRGSRWYTPRGHGVTGGEEFQGFGFGTENLNLAIAPPLRF